ncbi:hypothetical protein TWF569_000914 [Orbilia oligospora]|uniref:Uncharacterized protein n=1 Tax=Orbilia oligospora TaxID=2813651 RepID=A0A7C8NZS6_ORBOL|nr:hypothetical protein TWF703_001485 [Orbilia oligospora]KAF3154078.1 hypothetical protein TWF569_000914 [Orbilia oligospora]
MASKIFKRMSRWKPTPGSGNSGLEEDAPPPYHYNENATVSTVHIVKPIATYVENVAVEDFHLGDPRRRSETFVATRGVEGQENSEVRKSSLERGRDGYFENQAWRRQGRVFEAQGYENAEGRLPELPVPPPPPPSTAPVSETPLPNFQGAPPSPSPSQRSNPAPPLPPKEHLYPEHSYPSHRLPLSRIQTETESTNVTHKTETMWGPSNEEEDDDDGNKSDASDDSFVIANSRIISQQQEFDALILQKLNIATAVEKQQWDIAFSSLDGLIKLVEERKGRAPLQWYLELVRLGLHADVPYENIRRLPSNNEEMDSDIDLQRKLRAEYMIFQGILATKRGDDKVSKAWFIQGSKFARDHNFLEEMNICYWMLKENYTKSGNAEKAKTYEDLTPGYNLSKITEYLRPRVFRLDATAMSLRQEECLLLLDKLLLRKDVAEDEDKKVKYRQILQFTSACYLQHTISSSIISDIYGIEATEVLQLINSATSVFIPTKNLDSEVKIANGLLCPIICRNSRSPAVSHYYFSSKEPIILSDMLQRLFILMNNVLVEDICKIKMYGTPRAEIAMDDRVKCIRASLRFAYHQWLTHFMYAKAELPLSELGIFLEEHWLHWIELIGLLGVDELNRIISMTKFLRTNAAAKKRMESLPPVMAEKIKNLEKFLKRYGDEIAKTPLQVYYLWRFFEFEESSVSPSTPKLCVKVDIYDSQNQDDTAKKLAEGYNDLLMVVKPGTNGKQKVVFSHDLRLVAYSLPNSPIVIVRDLTKKSDGIILEHGQEKVYEIYFSPKIYEDHTVALITDPTKVTLWNISDVTNNSKATFKATYYPPEKNQHLKMLFSPDGKFMAFLCSKTNVSLRSIKAGVEVWNQLDSGDILDMAFVSADSTALVVIDNYGDIKVCKKDYVFEGERLTLGWGQSFLEEGSMKILDGEKKRVAIWAKGFGVYIRPLGTKEGQVVLECSESRKKRTTVVISPNGKRIAAIQDKGGIQIFDSETGRCIQSFWRLNQMYGETTLAAAFLPSGDRLITISKEMGMRVWELLVEMEIKNGWVVRGDEKVMWIPGNYHARIADVVKTNVVVLTHPSGRILEVEFGIDKGRVMEPGGAYGLVSNVMAYLPSLPKGLPSIPALPRSLPTFGWGSTSGEPSSSSDQEPVVQVGKKAR